MEAVIKKNGISLLSPRRRVAIKALALTPFLSIANAALSQEMALSTAINRAGRLRALSQRTAKAHIQLALGVLPDKSQGIATTAQALILSHLKELKTSEQRGGQRVAPALLAQVESDANGLLTMAASTPTKRSALEVSDQSDRLLLSADKLTEAYSGIVRATSGKLVNLAGRQRMVSQRVAKLYFLGRLGHGSESANKEIQKLTSEFKTNLATLSGAPISTPAIQTYLELGRTQWVFLEDAIADKTGDAVRMRNVATSSERVLEVMNDLANEYEIALKEIA